MQRKNTSLAPLPSWIERAWKMILRVASGSTSQAFGRSANNFWGVTFGARSENRSTSAEPVVLNAAAPLVVCVSGEVYRACRNGDTSSFAAGCCWAASDFLSSRAGKSEWIVVSSADSRDASDSGSCQCTGASEATPADMTVYKRAL